MKRRRQIYHTHYTMMDELMAAPTQPLPEAKRVPHIANITKALDSIISAETPSLDDWRILSDVVNMIETLTTHAGGHWPDCDGDLVHMQDETGLLMQAITAMAMAGKRHMDGGKLRLDGPGIAALRAIIESYEDVITQVPERTMVKCHRLTERRLQDIFNGRKQAHDIELVSV